MVFLNILSLFASISVVCVGDNTSQVVRDNNWFRSNFAINEQNNSITNVRPLTITDFFGSNYSFDFSNSGGYYITFVSNYSETIDGITTSYDFSVENIVISYDGDSDYYSFGSTYDNDIADSGFNYSISLFIFNDSNDYFISAFNPSPLYLTQWDYYYGELPVDSSFSEINFYNIQFNLFSREELGYISSDYIGQNPDYQTGYEQGKKEGYEIGFGDGARSTGSEQYDEGYSKGYADGLSVHNEGHITEIFSNIIQVGILPVNFFLKILNFEVFGINIGHFVSGLLTIAIIVIIVRVITGTGAGSGGSSGGGSNGS